MEATLGFIWALVLHGQSRKQVVESYCLGFGVFFVVLLIVVVVVGLGYFSLFFFFKFKPKNWKRWTSKILFLGSVTCLR